MRRNAAEGCFSQPVWSVAQIPLSLAGNVFDEFQGSRNVTSKLVFDSDNS